MLQTEGNGAESWISKDITIQLVSACIGDLLSNICEDFLRLVDSDDNWVQQLTKLRHYLWPENNTEGIFPSSHLEMRDKANNENTNYLSFDIKKHEDLIQGLLKLLIIE